MRAAALDAGFDYQRVLRLVRNPVFPGLLLKKVGVFMYVRNRPAFWAYLDGYGLSKTGIGKWRENTYKMGFTEIALEKEPATDRGLDPNHMSLERILEVYSEWGLEVMPARNGPSPLDDAERGERVRLAVEDATRMWHSDARNMLRLDAFEAFIEKVKSEVE